MERRAERGSRQGFSLALVLLVSTIVLFLGTALAALSSVSLNMAGQLLARSKAEAVARGVTAQVCFELDQRVWNQPRWSGAGYPDMAWGKDALRNRFRRVALFPDASQQVLESGTRAWVDFDASNWYSVDNLVREAATTGWLDRGTSRASVPPFSLDLVINTGTGDDLGRLQDARHFHAVIARDWPYAAYSIKSPIVVANGSRVGGNLYGMLGNVFVGQPGSLPVQVKGQVCVSRTSADTPVRIAAGSSLTGKVRFKVPPVLGVRGDSPTGIFDAGGIVTVPDAAPNPSSTFDPFQVPPVTSSAYQFESDPRRIIYVDELQGMLGTAWPGTCPIPKSYRDQTNKLLERVTIWRGNPHEQVRDLNAYRGALRFRLPGSVGGKAAFGGVIVDPLSGAAAASDSASGGVRVLVDDLNLSNGHYTIGPLTNHFAVMSGDKVVDDLWTGNRDHPSTINLTNAILVVQGDLDIRDLTGENSTLLVMGNLFLNGGRLDARNKGMLILAQNVYMESRGDFRGLVAARGSMLLKPALGNEQLTIRGALLAGGQNALAYAYDASGQLEGAAGLMGLNNTALEYDSRYTKALNRLGVARVMIFQEIP